MLIRVGIRVSFEKCSESIVLQEDLSQIKCEHIWSYSLSHFSFLHWNILIQHNNTIYNIFVHNFCCKISQRHQCMWNFLHKSLFADKDKHKVKVQLTALCMIHKHTIWRLKLNQQWQQKLTTICNSSFTYERQKTVHTHRRLMSKVVTLTLPACQQAMDA